MGKMMGKGDFRFTDAIVKDELNIFKIVDTSGSMTGERINQLNCAVSEALAAFKDAARKAEIKLKIRMIEFNNFAEWIMGKAEEGVDIEQAEALWTDLTAKAAGTNTAAAIRLACEAMHTEYLGTRTYHPIVILITDGESNNFDETLQAIEELKLSLKSSTDPSKEKIQRIAVGVVNANRQELEAFASKGNIEHADGTVEEDVPLVFNVDNVSELTGLLKNIALSSVVSSVASGADQNSKLTIVEEEEEEEGEWEV